MFDLAPVSLWLEDLSALKILFDTWRREGVSDLRAYLNADIERVRACGRCCRTLHVNRKTLSLFEAPSLAYFKDNTEVLFSDAMLVFFVDELVQLWSGRVDICLISVNSTFTGRRMDVILSGRLLPGSEETWDRYLMAIEDITLRETASRQAALSEAYARGLFDHSPVALWVEDFSGVKHRLDALRQSGVVDLSAFIEAHPEFLGTCMEAVRVIDVNQRTLDLLEAPTKAILLERLGDVFRDTMTMPFREQLIDLWHGVLFQQREVVNHTLLGNMLHLRWNFSVLPSHEADWSRVQIALIDITGNKRAQAHLEFLSKHDVLTGLYNRSAHVEAMKRLTKEARGRAVSVIVIDLNGLKAINDNLGHLEGDAVLRRAGAVISETVGPPGHAARAGGDEFLILLPDTDERGAADMADRLARAAACDNRDHADLSVSLSMGTATWRGGEPLEAALKRADLHMYDAKRRHYASLSHDLSAGAERGKRRG